MNIQLSVAKHYGGREGSPANQKAEAAFVGRCGPLQNQSGSTMAASAHHKAEND